MNYLEYLEYFRSREYSKFIMSYILDVTATNV